MVRKFYKRTRYLLPSDRAHLAPSRLSRGALGDARTILHRLGRTTNGPTQPMTIRI